MFFETHITVDRFTEELVMAVHVLGGKMTLIELDKGKTPIQPMVTFTGEGTLLDQMANANYLVDGFRSSGAKILRVKVETAYGNGIKFPSNIGRYHEQHVKIQLNDVFDWDGLPQKIDDLLVKHDAHLSWNSMKDPELHEYFFSQREYSHNVDKINTKFGDLLSAINMSEKEYGFTVLEWEREFVVYDSNPKLDEGWM